MKANFKGLYSDGKARKIEDIKLVPNNFLTRLLWIFLKVKVVGPPNIEKMLNEKTNVFGLIPRVPNEWIKDLKKKGGLK